MGSSSNSVFQCFLFMMFMFLYGNQQVQAAAANLFNVLQYGASGDGKTDNSKVQCQFPLETHDFKFDISLYSSILAWYN